MIPPGENLQTSSPPDPHYHLFFSYNRMDGQAVLAVHKALQSRQLRNFLDIDNLPIGLRWMRRIEDALRASNGVAVFLGAKGLGSFQEYEVEAAIVRQSELSRTGSSFPVVPVLLPGCDPEQVSYFLKVNTWIDLRHSIDDSLGLDRLVAAFRTRPSEETVETPALELCPYRELNAFREEDANLFVGRERFTDQLYQKVSNLKVTAVVGASGTGKSSVIQAGLLPKLRAESTATKEWVIVTLTPGQDPFASLAEAVYSHYEPNADGDKRVGGIKHLVSGLRSDDSVEGRTLKDITGEIKRLSGKQDCTTLFIVDQFEELFTLGPDQDRKPFVTLLLDDIDQGPFKLLLSFRLDYWTQVEGLSTPLNRRLEEGHVKLASMSPDELRRVIVEPARRVGLGVETELVERLLHDVEDDPDSLPLLEFALTQIWRQRKDGSLKAESYRLGDIAHAIAKRAEDELKDCKPGSTKEGAVRRAMCRLVRVSTDKEKDTRARVPLTEFSEDERTVVRALAKARLLVTSHDASTGKDVAEVTHEALIRNWPRLQDWIARDREFLLWRQDFQRDLDRWETGEGNPLSGLLLKKARRWRTERDGDLNERERIFISGSESLGRRPLRWTAAAAALIALVSVSWWFMTRSDWYQVDQVLGRGPALFASAPSRVSDYFAGVVYVGRYEEALETARAIPEHDIRFQTLADVANHLAQAGQSAVALEAAGAIDEDETRSRALVVVAKALAQAGQPDGARDTVRAIPENDARSQALAEVATALAQSGHRDSALEVAGMIADDPRAQPHADIAKALAQAGLPDAALKTARMNSDLVTRSQALADIAKAYAQAGQTQQARQTAEEALKAAGAIPEDLYGRTEALSHVAKSLAQAGLPDAALKATGVISDLVTRSQALADAAKAYAQAGQTQQAREAGEQAMQAATGIAGDLYNRGQALSNLATALAQAGQPDAALSAVTAIPQDYYGRTQAIVSLALALAQGGQPDWALRAAGMIPDSQALADLTKALAQAGQMQHALQAAEQALKAASAIPEDLYGGRTQARSYIAKALAQAGLLEAALETARMISDSQALADVAKAYAQAGRTQQARQTAEEALKTATTIPDDSYGYDLSYVATALAEAGLSDLALKAAGAISEDVRPNNLADVAVALIQSGFPDAALQAASEIPNESNTSLVLLVAKTLAEKGYADAALKAASAIPEDSYDRPQALADVAAALVQSGHPDAALKAASAISEDSDPSQPMSTVATAWAEAGQWDASLEAARKIPDDHTRSLTLAFVTEEMAQAGQTQQAWQALEGALEAARAIPDDYSRSENVTAAAVLCARMGNLFRARRTADEERLSSDQQLYIYTEILLAYAKKRDPTLAERLKQQE